MPIDFNVQVNDLVLGTVVQMYATDAQFAIATFPTRYSLAGTKTVPLTAVSMPANVFTTSAPGSWQNFGLVTMVPGASILKQVSSFVAKLQFTAGSPVCSACAVKRTLARSTAVVDTTLVTFNNGAAYPVTFVTPKTVFTDPIPVSLDNDHDYYFAFTFANVSANASAAVISGTALGTLSGFASGTDYTTATTMPSLGSGSELLLGFYA